MSTVNVSPMDRLRCPGFCEDYVDDEVALQREYEIGENLRANLADSGQPEDGLYHDPVFTPSARSLYFDPLNPPVGGIPHEAVQWVRLSEDVPELTGNSSDKPNNDKSQKSRIEDIPTAMHHVIFASRVDSPNILQSSSFSNKYFIEALTMLACQPAFLTRLFVSTRYAANGLYTLKIFKNGRWRYVHIDDYIPRTASGAFLTAINANRVEYFAMLIEKAYAKLHGCYEALNFGTVEEALQELTPGGCVNTLRWNTSHFPMVNIEKGAFSSEQVDGKPATMKKLAGSRAILRNKPTLCDELWDTLEQAVESKATIGCMRLVPDPFNDNPRQQQGIALGHIYQVVDLCVTTAEPTEDFDALTVGMVCVRNLRCLEVERAKTAIKLTQKKQSTKKTRIKVMRGRFNGRWSYGDRLWNDYKEIALDLSQRTKEIQWKRGLLTRAELENSTDIMEEIDPIDDFQHAPEHDEDYDPFFPSSSYFYPPRTGGLSSSGMVLDGPTNFMGTRMLQPQAEDLHWIQIEDFVSIFNIVHILTDLTIIRISSRGNEGIKSGGGKPAICQRFLSQWIPESGLQQGEVVISGSGGPPVILEYTSDTEERDVAQPDGSVIRKTVPIRRKEAFINPAFLLNPIIPFTVSEPTRIVFTLYQPNQRWNHHQFLYRKPAREGQPYHTTPENVPTSQFADRAKRMAMVMDYEVGIGFLLVRRPLPLPDNRPRLLRHLVGCSPKLIYGPMCSGEFHLLPGRYGLVPYTNTSLDRSLAFAVHAQFSKDHVEFDTSNNAKAKGDVLIREHYDFEDEAEEAGSPPTGDDDSLPPDQDLLRTHEDDDDVSIMSYEVLDEDDDQFDDEGQQSLPRETQAQKAERLPETFPVEFHYPIWETREVTASGLQNTKQLYMEVIHTRTVLSQLDAAMKRMKANL